MADATYDGLGAIELGRLLDAPRVEIYRSLPSTMDRAHKLGAEGAPAGTVVLADEQTAGRGRGGRAWTSEAGAGIWMTLLERPREAAELEVVSLRLALRLAAALDRFVESPIAIKWPNDLFVGGRKLAGILVETRWRDGRVDWVAIGLGVNARLPSDVPAATLRADTSRVAVLAEILPAMRAAARARGGLGTQELASFSRRDLARGRRCREPVSGVVAGVAADGALIVDTGTGTTTVRAGSLVIEEEL